MLHQNQPPHYRMIGLMSGSSLDGLDVCYCTFKKVESNWEYSIETAETFKYPAELTKQLKEAHTYNPAKLTALHFNFGKYIGELVKQFVTRNKIEVDYIASHGHTILHNPLEGYTLQIGNGAAIAAITGLPCICDFRSGDVARGGQGAPLVPIGDMILFHEYDICLNLGGFANISFGNAEANRLAYDICECNMLTNHLAGLLGKDFDCKGQIGLAGQVIPQMLHDLEGLDYYKQPWPKSLGREWFEMNIVPILTSYSNLSVADQMRTAYEHIANRIANDCNKLKKRTILATGGGARNNFLMELIRQKTNAPITIPDSYTIDFKEALIFAFLGVLYLQKEYGALSSVTGAKSSSITGCLYY